MGTSTAYAIASTSVNTLQGYFSAVLQNTSLLAYVIGITMLFVVFGLAKSLWHRNI